MKSVIKIAFALAFMLLPLTVNAQLRVGIEGGVGLNDLYPKTYTTHHDGNEGWLDGNAHLMFEYILPRTWTPRCLATSVRLGLGYSHLYTYLDYRNYSYGGRYYFDDEYLYNQLDIPIEAEVKYLFTNNIRAYLNGGMTYYYGINSEEHGVGGQLGLGFEFGVFRLGYKYVKVPAKLAEVDSWDNAHMLTLGFWFNGNRFLRKKSKLKLY